MSALGSTPAARANIGAQARQRWSEMAPRERLLIGVCGVLLLVLLMWWVAVGPAWRVTRAAPAQIDQLDAQLQRMQRMAAESKLLRAATPVSPAQAQLALKTSTDRLGDKARLTMAGDRATLTLNGVTGDALRTWLTEVRTAARGRTVEMKVMRGPQGLTGTVVVALGSTS